MKKLQQLCAVTTLLFVVSLPALAGEIHTNAVPPPPPPPPPTSARALEREEPTAVGTHNALESESIISEITMSLLQLLSVF